MDRPDLPDPVQPPPDAPGPSTTPAGPPPRWDFFISYTAADRTWAEWIAWKLEETGYRVLVQAWDFIPGTNWAVLMQQGVAEAARTLALLSHAYLASAYGQEEWQAAQAADPMGFKKKLIPIKIADCPRPGLLGQIVSFDLFDISEQSAATRLTEQIAILLANRAKPSTAPPFPAPHSHPSTPPGPEPAFPGLATPHSAPLSGPPSIAAGGKGSQAGRPTAPGSSNQAQGGPRPAARRRRFLRGKLIIPVAAVTALTVTAVVVMMLVRDGSTDHCDPVRIAASADLSEVLQQAATDYGLRSNHGQCVQVAVNEVNSGVAMVALARGWTKDDGVMPDVWSPAGTAWLELARERATAQTRALFPAREADVPPVVTSPLTIAMPEPMARALGWPTATIGWRDLVAWAKNADQFWAQHGKPEWGAFKLGKTNPSYSTSGLNATIAAFFAATGRTDELVAADIDNDANKAFDSAIEHAAVHYGDTTLTFLANLRHADAATSYISAVTVEEAAVVAYNAGYPCGALSAAPGCQKTSPPNTKLVAFYPRDGILYSDHPYIELAGMSAAKKAVADDFLAYLHSDPVVQAHFAPAGFRTYQGEATALITQANGTLPEAPINALPLPPADVLDRLLAVWPTLRKQAQVLVLIDTSGSMGEPVDDTTSTKIELLRQAEPALLGGFADTDRVGLWRFSSADVLGDTDYQPLVPVGPMNEQLPGGTRRTVLPDVIATRLSPGGSTGLYNTIDAAVRSMRASYDPTAINAIVLLTDGRNQITGGMGLPDLLRNITAPGQPQIKIFSIAYGNEADQAEQPCPAGGLTQDVCGKTILREISTATGAREYDAKDPTTITNVLANVISNF